MNEGAYMKKILTALLITYSTMQAMADVGEAASIEKSQQSISNRVQRFKYVFADWLLENNRIVSNNRYVWFEDQIKSKNHRLCLSRESKNACMISAERMMVLRGLLPEDTILSNGEELLESKLLNSDQELLVSKLVTYYKSLMSHVASKYTEEDVKRFDSCVSKEEVKFLKNQQQYGSADLADVSSIINFKARICAGIIPDIKTTADVNSKIYLAEKKNTEQFFESVDANLEAIIKEYPKEEIIDWLRRF